VIAAIAKSALNGVHERVVFNRRVEVLVGALAQSIPDGRASILDLGCGDGQVGLGLTQTRPELTVTGVDVLRRPVTHIPVTLYDGVTLPFADESHDFVCIVDVLHHTDDAAATLAEAARVARRGVIVKDHLREGWFAGPTLRAMDWVGNRGHDVRLPYNYLNGQQWNTAINAAGLVRQSSRSKLGLYPVPLSWWFERQLHFVALLGKAERASNEAPVG
jgi:SAM-dependent methyltransferase